jgi:hypothetical protein
MLHGRTSIASAAFSPAKSSNADYTPLDSWCLGERKEGIAIDLTFERQEYTGRTCP